MTSEEDYGSNKSRLKNIILSIYYSKGKWYFGLLTTMLILLWTVSGEFNLIISKAYAERQIYETQMQHKPMLLTSISAGEQQGTQQSTRNQTGMQQPLPQPPPP